MKGVSLMEGYQTGHPELKSAAEELVNGNSDLMQQLSQLATAVDGVAGQWTGAAHTAFNTLMGKFQADAKTLNDKLLVIAENVSGSADAYQRQEEQASESLSQISTALEG
jgi:WXG100 family type VII secretion target